MEKEGLDTGISNVVKELNVLKQNLVAQASLGHTKKKYPSFWTMKPDGSATSGRFQVSCDMFKDALQQLVSKGCVKSAWQKLALGLISRVLI